MRSHPPTLLTLLRSCLRGEARVQRGARIVVAVSGGVDSMVLLHGLAWLAPKLGFSLCAHGVDHGLRAAAASELDLAESLARRLAVPFSRSRVTLAAGGNLQARARTARYEQLRITAQALGAQLIATAHHADDRAETVLLRLLRGTSPRGLAVLPARSEDLIRPLLRATRADVLAHAERHQIPHAEDPSNKNPRFLRTRVRHELLPLLRELSPGIVQHLNALADECVQTPADLPDLPRLGRAQRLKLQDLLAHPSRSARIRLSGGRELWVEPGSGKILLGSVLGDSPAPDTAAIEAAKAPRSHKT